MPDLLADITAGRAMTRTPDHTNDAYLACVLNAREWCAARGLSYAGETMKFWHWRMRRDRNQTRSKGQDKGRAPRRVRNRRTGIVYPSGREAMRLTRSSARLLDSLATGKPYRGDVWEYVYEDEEVGRAAG